MMIYVLEDDESIRELIIYTLNGQNMQAKGFSAPSEFWSAMKESSPSGIAGYYVAGGGRLLHFTKIALGARNQTPSGHYADCKGQRI